MDQRLALLRNLWFGLACGALTLLAGLLALILKSGGDTVGATAVMGVVWVMATATVISLIVQVALLTMYVLSLPQTSPTKSPCNESLT